MSSQDGEYDESLSITFQWTLHNLKQIFDSSRGSQKCRAIKSPFFGGGRWQVLFYANAGTPKESIGSPEGGGFVSLFLACEPTAEEKESALGDSGKWTRKGLYKFSFELRNTEKTMILNQKEASNHTFACDTSNWGWAQFARRDAVYYQSLHAKAQDAFVIVCTISSSPKPVPLSTPVPRLLIPKSLLETIGSLLDDPRYSDVEFIILRRGQEYKSAQRIWASRKVLQRIEHFDAMLGTHFSEGTTDNNPNTLLTPRVTTRSLRSQGDYDGYSHDEYLDSDAEDDDYDNKIDDEDEVSSQMETSDNESLLTPGIQDDEKSLLHPTDSDYDQQDDQPVTSKHQSDSSSVTSMPASTSARHVEDDSVDHEARRQYSAKPHMTVVIKDIAYNTYRALLYYLYTDHIVFAPLSSSFISSRVSAKSCPIPSSTDVHTPLENAFTQSKRNGNSRMDIVCSRREWVKEWEKSNPGRPAPCSAKAIYREADRLDLKDLKERAAQHIINSLTVENIAYEVFSPFASTFEEIRKVEIEYFLEHWQSIRSSESMKNIWPQIRKGKHPGFEEVWPAIAMHLDYRATSPASDTQPNKNGNAQQIR